MRNKILHFVVSGLLSATSTVANAQLATASDNLVANKIITVNKPRPSQWP